MKRSDSAAANISAGRMNCAQAVLTAYCEELGLGIALARKIALGFGGGMGRTGKTCGAVSGAYMVIGLKQNITPENASQVKDKTYALVREFNRRFTELHGSTSCKDLLGCDLGTPEGVAIAAEKKFFTTLCPQFVHDAVEMLEEMSL
jgi:C_GCAxxG_C_C family probable redox protein